MKRIELVTASIVGIVLLAGMILSHTKEAFFLNRLVVEDGPLEWLGALGFLLCGFLMLKRFFQFLKIRPPLFLLTTLGAAGLFFFVFGEEISWGQRIFDVETPEWLEENNRQSEMNFHNLELGGVSINKLVFSKLLAVALVLYLLVTPVLYRKKPAFARLVDRLGIPLPQNHHIILWIAMMLIGQVLVGTGKRGEMCEFAAPFLLLIQLLYPLNHWIYGRGWKPGDEARAPVA